MTPPGFLKDCGEAFRARPYLGGVAHGWNLSLGADHFVGYPSQQRSSLPGGSAGAAPTGPDPTAPGPAAVSEKDSCAVLPPYHAGCGCSMPVRPQWSLEVEPGQYLVIVSVGDRFQGFPAYVEVGTSQIFRGEWVEAAEFRSRCVLCETATGLITVSAPGPAPKGPKPPIAGSKSPRQTQQQECCGSDPNCPHLELGGCGSGSFHAGSGRGTRLVSVRVVSLALIREVERDLRHNGVFLGVNQKISDREAKLEQLLQSRLQGHAVADRELGRALQKLDALKAEKALRLHSLTAAYKRVSHPYIYADPREPPTSVPPPKPPLGECIEVGE